MFLLAISIGIFSYIIFFLGIFGLLYKPVLITISILFILALVFYFRHNFIKSKIDLLKNKKENIIILILILIIIQTIVNLIGALGPELGFDALWYHLTIPKNYLINHKIYYIPGGLLYYSAMPKLAEMLYAAGLAFGYAALPKLIHFSFGILSGIALYLFSRKIISKKYSLLAVLIFYSNLVVGWESITAYIDLVRTFFELMALWGFINWIENKNKKWFIISAIILGFSITTKYLSLGTLIIFLILNSLYLLSQKKSIKNMSILNMFYLLLALIPVVPWIIFSYLNTGHLFYPFFTNTYPISLPFYLLNPFLFINAVWMLFTHAADPISPVYIAVLPLIIALPLRELLLMNPVLTRASHAGIINHKLANIKFLYLYSILSIIIWYFTPRTGGGRFILPYLPAFSILASYLISVSKKNIKKAALLFVILVSIINLGYRTAANIKYLPVIFGSQTKTDFLKRNLNFSFGDFYDTDDYFKKNTSKNDKFLLIGFHNLYYVDFPFIDGTWVSKKDLYNKIAIQNGLLSNSFTKWKEIFYNPITHVRVYDK